MSKEERRNELIEPTGSAFRDLGDGVPVRVSRCPMCGIIPTAPDDCGMPTPEGDNLTKNPPCKSATAICYVNKDGTVNKAYVRKMWNHVMKTMIDSYNGDIDDSQFEKRVKQFRPMANDLVLHNSTELT